MSVISGCGSCNGFGDAVGTTRGSVCSSQNPLALGPWFAGVPECPKGYLPVRDPKTGGWKKINFFCYECSPVSVIDPTTGKKRWWAGTEGPETLSDAVDAAANYWKKIFGFGDTPTPTGGTDWIFYGLIGFVGLLVVMKVAKK